MNRNTGSKSQSQPQPAQPPRNPNPGTQKQGSQHTSAGEAEHVEGEGSYTATHRYNEGVREHLQTHDVEAEAEEAREALEGDERPELEEAERRGKARAAEQERRAPPKPTKH